MNKWGQQMIAAVSTVAEMAAIGCECGTSVLARAELTPAGGRFELPQNAFVELMQDGPHLLAPTGAARCAHL